jgi:1-deoxy-D-xylulose-5-phosphate reductoisomerase
VIRQHPDLFTVEVLTAGNNADLLIRQALEFIPNAIVIGNEKLYQKVSDALASKPVKVFAGPKAIEEIVEMESVDLVLNALVGYAGLLPTVRALGNRKLVALANKETLVAAGELVMRLARENRTLILPVDSEHSAIFQCLVGEEKHAVEKIWLTASGGPFRGKNRDHLKEIKKEAALKHPNWKMGKKVTIDSASLMNKGLEVIEAKWLFDLAPEQIDVVVHPQSIIHSLVGFTDGSMKAQMGLPDMKLPILYAMAFPHRLKTDFPRFSFPDNPCLTFEPPDREIFRNLDLAYHALAKGGNVPCTLNAANEIAVQAFLEDTIGFLEMPDVIEYCMNTVSFLPHPALEDYVATTKEAQRKAKEFIRKMK